MGYVESKEFVENKLNKYMSDTNGNIAFREIENLPKYDFKLINREKETEEKGVMLAIENTIVTTYKMFAVTVDGEQKVILNSQENAENLVNEIKKGVNEKVDLKLGIVEIYTQENKITSTEEAKNTLNEVKEIKVAAYEKEQAAKKRAALAKNKANSIATTATSAPTGNISGIALSIPVNGTVTSRFGSRGYSRSSAHTGVDIPASAGTGIRAMAPGTVTYASYKGSYGNLIIVNHGNGIESYYAHCNALYVSAGQTVDSNTTIAAVGSTGNSTGPHLHLEIRINGTPVNPQNYLY